jgi:Kef-type K+ transport system membrane component KefB
MIAVAAMVDDVVSLVILAVLSEIGKAEGQADTRTEWAWLVVKPVLVSLAVIAAGGLLLWLVPSFYRWHRGWITAKLTDRAAKLTRAQAETQVEQRQDSAIVVGMLLVTCTASICAGLAGSSYLLGAFSAGMAFSQLRATPTATSSRAEELWSNHASVGWWLTAVSFATLGFSIPTVALFSADGLGLGLLFCVPAFLGKFVLGTFAPAVVAGRDSFDGSDGGGGGCCGGGGGFRGNFDDALIIGWAMVARGELGFVMAQQARRDDLMDDSTYAASVWALFICTLLPPFMFGHALRRKRRKQTAAEDDLLAVARMVTVDIDISQNGNSHRPHNPPVASTATDTSSPAIVLTPPQGEVQQVLHRSPSAQLPVAATSV